MNWDDVRIFLAVARAGQILGAAKRLELNHATAGSHTLQAQGIVLPNGIFGSTSLGQKVVGAASFDGKSAGYMYEKAVESGTFNGITLWGR